MPKLSLPRDRKLKFAISGNALAVREGLADAIASLQFLKLSDEENGSIELVLAEVMNNIVEHAYADTPDGIIKLAIQPNVRGLYCTLKDNGQPMPDGAVPLGNLTAVNDAVDDLPEGGFGWFLIRDLARDLKYTRKSGKNKLTFRMAITMPQSSIS